MLIWILLKLKKNNYIYIFNATVNFILKHWITNESPSSVYNANINRFNVTKYVDNDIAN